MMPLVLLKYLHKISNISNNPDFIVSVVFV